MEGPRMESGTRQRDAQSSAAEVDETRLGRHLKTWLSGQMESTE